MMQNLKKLKIVRHTVGVKQGEQISILLTDLLSSLQIDIPDKLQLIQVNYIEPITQTHVLEGPLVKKSDNEITVDASSLIYYKGTITSNIVFVCDDQPYSVHMVVCVE